MVIWYKSLEARAGAGLSVFQMWYKNFIRYKKLGDGMEKQIEKRLAQKIKEKNGLCLKLTGYKGIPDRLVLVDGRCYFIELKDNGKQLRPEQKVWQDKLKSMGFEAVMLDSKEAVDDFVKGVIKDGR